jgi:hypothetical protein
MLTPDRCKRAQAGQVIAIVAMMMIVILAAIGLAIDGATAFYYNRQAEKAAAAAALSGVVFMPQQFAPCCGGNNATDRAIAEARRNGFDTADSNVGSSGVQVAPSSTGPSSLTVTVSRDVPTFFMAIFGTTRIRISRTATATFLTPIQLGQPGNQLGSTVSQLGAGANSYFFQRSEGWGTDRQEGDPFTPNPCHEFGQNPIPPPPCPNDVHQISGSTADPVGTNAPLNLPSRGGQNYMITLPAGGGQVLIYNAAFAPDCDPSTQNCSNSANRCENQSPITGNSSYGHGRPCATANTNYNYHEHDSFGGGMNSTTKYATMAYTLFKVSSYFFRDQDVAISTLVVKPVNATSWDPNPPTAPSYKDPATGADVVTQQYQTGCNPCGSPQDAVNMWTYHHWLDPHTYAGSGDAGLVTLNIWSSLPAALSAGTYRLRVDTLNQDGTWNPYTNSVAHKGYAVAVSAPGATNQPLACGQCSLGAWNDMTVYTPVVGTTWSVPIFQLPKAYAGQTVVVDIFDVGDVSGGSPSQIRILDPQTGQAASPPPGKFIDIYDLGRQRLKPNPPLSTACSYSGPYVNGENIPNAPCTVSHSSAPNSAAFQSYSGTRTWFNGHWAHMEIPVRPDYDPTGTDAYWRFQYYPQSGSLNATDTFSVRVDLKGAPAHLLGS